MPRVEVLTTLKSEGHIWRKGELLSPPFPRIIKQELQLNRGTVRIVPDPVEPETMQEIVEEKHITTEKPKTRNSLSRLKRK